jgi:hypothetical protein
MENECPTYSTRSNLYAQHDIYHIQEYDEVEEIFTDLQACENSTDTDSRKNMQLKSVYLLKIDYRIFIFEFIRDR